jgi:hypothetical protein
VPPWLAELNQKRQRQAVAVPPTPPPAAAAKPISSTPQPTPPPRPVRPEPPSGVKGLAEEEAGAATAPKPRSPQRKWVTRPHALSPAGTPGAGTPGAATATNGRSWPPHHSDGGTAAAAEAGESNGAHPQAGAAGAAGGGGAARGGAAEAEGVAGLKTVWGQVVQLRADNDTLEQELAQAAVAGRRYAAPPRPSTAPHPPAWWLLRAQAAPVHPGAPPEHLASSPRPS